MNTYSSKPQILQFISLLLANGITHAVVCAGSRSAPLVHSLAACPEIRCIPLVDERSAAFTAIGMSQALGGKPVVVCCTSGSALLNMAPAVAEAHYQDIPLLVVSADRPPAWIGQMDAQTMVQPGAFHNFIRHEVNLPEPHDAESLWHCNLLLNQAILALGQERPGPVHVNMPISEPLFGFTELALPTPRVIRRTDARSALSPTSDLLSALGLEEIWKNSRRPLVVVGQLPPEHHLEESLHLVAQGDVLVLTEKLGNLNGLAGTANVIDLAELALADPEILASGENFGESWLSAAGKAWLSAAGNAWLSAAGKAWMSPAAKSWLSAAEEAGLSAAKEGGLSAAAENLCPDLVITLGGHIVSKRLKLFLRHVHPARHWHVSPDGASPDLFQCLTHAVQAPARSFLRALPIVPRNGNDPLFLSEWNRRNALAHGAVENIPQEFSDLVVMQHFLQHIPPHSALQIGNSMPLRNAEFFPLPENVHVFCNRGINGIDGCLSTAVGYASLSDRPTFCVIGDLSFFHDQNAFWRDDLPSNLRVLLFNNGGGAIFHTLPDLSSPFAASHIAGRNTRSAQSVAGACGFEYARATTLDELDSILPDFCNPAHKGSMVLEVKTNMEACTRASRNLSAAMRVQPPR